MSRSLRPVKVEWGTASSVFISSEDAINLFEGIAAVINSAYSTEEHGECTEVWIENGRAYLDYIEGDAFTLDVAREHVTEESREGVEDLFENMKLLARDDWRRSVNLRDGELRFYID